MDAIIERASAIDAVKGIIVIGSFAGGQPDALSDLDLLVVAPADRLDEAWDARHDLARDAFVTWEPQSNEGREIRWLNWLTHDLVKVECGVAAPGSKELAEPFAVVSGPASIAESFPRVDRMVVAERAGQRRDQQRDFDPEALSPEERLGWKLAEMKKAARDLLRRERDGA